MLVLMQGGRVVYCGEEVVDEARAGPLPLHGFSIDRPIRAWRCFAPGFLNRPTYLGIASLEHHSFPQSALPSRILDPPRRKYA